MIGPEGAALALTTILEANLAAKVLEVTARLNATRLPMIERALLTPKTIEAFDVMDLPLEACPAVLVIGQRLVNLTRVDYGDTIADAAQPLYRSRYNVRTIVWARGRTGTGDDDPTGKAADVARKRLLLAVREVYLAAQTAAVTIGNTADLNEGDDGYRPGYTVRATIDEATLVESYSDVVTDGESTIAAAYIELDVLIEETIDLNPAAQLPAEVNVAVGPIPPPAP